MKRGSACIRSPALDEEICHALDTNVTPRTRLIVATG
jgi:hypothetical protein